MTGPALTGDIVQTAGVSKTLSGNLMGFERPIPTGVHLNLAESYTCCDGGYSVNLRIRKGVKWSDGVFFTVDDILFWYYDVQLNDDARDTALPPPEWLAEGRSMGMEKIDDYILRVFSHKPLGRIVYNFCFDRSMFPKHYFGPLHPTSEPTENYVEFHADSTRAQRLMKPGALQLGAWMPG